MASPKIKNAAIRVENRLINGCLRWVGTRCPPALGTVVGRVPGFGCGVPAWLFQVVVIWLGLWADRVPFVIRRRRGAGRVWRRGFSGVFRALRGSGRIRGGGWFRNAPVC